MEVFLWEGEMKVQRKKKSLGVQDILIACAGGLTGFPSTIAKQNLRTLYDKQLFNNRIQ